MSKEPAGEAQQSEDVSEQASHHTLALNPLMGLREKDLLDGAQAILRSIVNEPRAAATEWMSFVGDMAAILSGASERKPEKGDKRFVDPAWQKSKLHGGLLQAYLAWGNAVSRFVDQTSLSDIDKARAHLFSTIFVDALAPTNTLLGNPAAMREFIDSGGQSLFRGFRHYLEDLSKNGGMPAQVDKSGFTVGGNLANAPGAVVFRNDLVELIQYTPTTPNVRKRPLVVVPPQINKYYSLDLSPDKSMVRFLVGSGLQPFCLSWRNPTPKQREWGLDAYVAAVDAAVDAAREITGSEDVTIMGACSGGITACAYLGTLAAKGEPKVKSAVLAVCVLDLAHMEDSAFSPLMTPQTVGAAKEASRTKGVLDGQELGRMFAWMRPNDLVWNYWVNNYLLGNNPPAFDILFWNADTTRLPAQLHSDYLDMYATNPFIEANKMSLNGAKVDMKKVKVDTYVVAGVTDHITPWKSVYRTAKIMGDETTFVLSNSGHLQSLINPPGNIKASFTVERAREADADGFLKAGRKQSDSWWLHWRDWLYERSGDEVPAPASLGSERHPSLGPAPGTYVFEQ